NILGHNIIQHSRTSYRRINHPAAQRNTTVVLVLQPQFVMLSLSSLVVGLFGAVLMSSPPGRPAT
ncbi:hypothetical protein, partial [Nocardia sp. NPDC004604]|uniref:hypothetical protein n=1 Tax=Nocardia sp. NPDC004604 TaxID=3157013 RepID=UPI0033AA5161